MVERGLERRCIISVGRRLKCIAIQDIDRCKKRSKRHRKGVMEF